MIKSTEEYSALDRIFIPVRPTYPESEVVFRPKSLIVPLCAIVFMLMMANLAGQTIKYLTEYKNLFGLIDKLDLEAENNLPAYFSGVLLLMTSGILWIIARIKYQEQNHFRARWRLLAVLFLCLSVDEVASLHELISPAIHIFYYKPGVLAYAWIIPAIVGLVILGIMYLKFLWHLPGRSRILFIISAAIFISGAVGSELVEGHLEMLYGKASLVYNLVVTVEEVMEMLGVICFIYTLLDYLEKQVGTEIAINLRIS